MAKRAGRKPRLEVDVFFRARCFSDGLRQGPEPKYVSPHIFFLSHFYYYYIYIYINDKYVHINRMTSRAPVYPSRSSYDDLRPAILKSSGPPSP